MGASKEKLISERDAQESALPLKKSLFNIRQDHLTLLALIEESEGELTPEMQEDLKLNEEGFKEKAISYAYVVKKLDAESDVIAAEIKRLQSLKSCADKKADLFKQMLDEGMKQFGHEKIESELLKITYRKSAPVELVETFEDDILKYCRVQFEIDPAKEEEAIIAGIERNTLNAFDIKLSPSKTRIGGMLKEGMTIPGASMPEKNNLQIK